MEAVTREVYGGGVESDYADDSSLYYSQQSMFPPHRPDKDMLVSSSASSTGQLSQLGASLYGPQSALGFPMRGMNSSAAPQLSRSGLNQSASQLSSHASTPNAGTMHTPPSPSRYSTHTRHTHPGGNSSRAVKCFWNSTPPPAANAPSETYRGILPMSSRSVLNHSQQVGGPTGQAGGMGGVGVERGGGGGGGGGRSGSMGVPAARHPASSGCPNSSRHGRRSLLTGFGVNRNPGFSLNNSLSNNIFNGTDGSENVTGLDLSDFPALADRSRRDGGSNPTPLLNPLAGRAPYVGMVTKPSSEQSQDFSIHNEDFPALPGPNYQTKDPTSTNEDSKTNLNTSGKPTSNSDGPKFPGDKSSAPSNNNQQKKGIQVLPDGRVTNIPVGMVTDQFGMIGLLTFIRAAETDPGMVHLALGSDLTTLGLNLNSPENLYPKFASPWASAPCRPQDIDFHVPSEYLTNIHIRDKLAAIKLSRYGMEPTLKTNAYERGTYYFFDCLNWRKVAKEFHLEYDKLEERPHVPSTFNYNPAQQAF
ncbi:hypothetical protein INR49_019396 [Caranx melampygus]|nr:hypothetical protein INR49_019396 [Caranx melampygus]